MRCEIGGTAQPSNFLAVVPTLELEGEWKAVTTPKVENLPKENVQTQGAPEVSSFTGNRMAA